MYENAGMVLAKWKENMVFEHLSGKFQLKKKKGAFKYKQSGCIIDKCPVSQKLRFFSVF
jgi:hypothetical protein